jgi:hypothetical protein
VNARHLDLLEMGDRVAAALIAENLFAPTSRLHALLSRIDRANPGNPRPWMHSLPRVP